MAVRGDKNVQTYLEKAVKTALLFTVIKHLSRCKQIKTAFIFYHNNKT